MNRIEFLQRLEQALREMPVEERRRAMEYYENYFDEAGAENEEEVLRTLGAPEKVAADILREFTDMAAAPADRRTAGSWKSQIHKMDRGQKLLLVVLTVVAAVCIVPACVGLIGGLGGVLVAVLCIFIGIFLIVPALCLAAWAAAIACCVVAGMTVMSNVPDCLMTLGLGLIFMALGILLGQATAYLFRTVFPAVLNKVVAWIRGLGGGK